MLFQFVTFNLKKRLFPATVSIAFSAFEIKPQILSNIFLLGLLGFVLLMFAIAKVCYAADPQPYIVTLESTTNTQLDKLLADASTLISLQKSAEVGPFALLARAKQDQERFVMAMQSLGYYQGKAVLHIASHTLDDPELFDYLSSSAADPPVPVTASFQLGPQFHLRQIRIAGEVEQSIVDVIKLKTGDKAIAEEVLAVRTRLLNALLEQGYALAKVDEPVATLSLESAELDILFKVDSGPKVKLGHIAIVGLKNTDESFVRERLLVSTGQAFKSSDIETARKDLNELGIFSAVRVSSGQQLDQQGQVPLNFDVAERPLHSANMGAAYSTDLGGSLSSAWLRRNLFGHAEQLSLSAALTQLGGNSTTGLGYKVGAAFSKPDFLVRDQALQIGLDALQQNFTAYNETALLAHTMLNRKLSQHWQGGYGIAAEQAQISQENIQRDYTLLSLPLTLKYDSSNNLLDPTQGSIASAALTPTYSMGGSHQPFVLLQVSASTYLELGEPGRRVLALRGLLGDSAGASQFDLPPDKRFYAGGSATVRGYKYQSVGPKFADSVPQGGTAIAAASVELRQRIMDDYGVVVFADAGQVSVNALPFSNRWQMGAGVGARYYTSFGPIRLDVAVPVNPVPGSGSFEVYIGLGQAF
ncbi:BamA/TamA family outer membrane protein [Methylomonas sp. AM2-LC]|uniref:autotransporter assembly complex protein TamA n=1 Tax=Methylomonas sp. AM2-LC TaxID=3153301 RepID=UPI0032667A5F